MLAPLGMGQRGEHGEEGERRDDESGGRHTPPKSNQHAASRYENVAFAV